MKHLRRFFVRLYELFANSRVEAELAKEIGAHLTLLEDEYLRQGMTPEDARRAARLAYGGVEQAKQLHRDERGFQGLDRILQDTRYTFRKLIKSPGFTATAILMLALGIGATTAIFSIVEAVLLRPLPFPEPDRLVTLGDQVEGRRGIVELDLPALDAGKTGLERAGQSANRGIAGHDLDQRRGRFELARDLADLFGRQEQEAVLLEEFAGAERGDRLEVLLVGLQLRGKRLRGRAGQLGRRRLDDSQDQPLAIKGFLELVVALAPIQIRRDQLVDVGVDREVAGRIEAGADRQQHSDNDNRKGKTRTGPNNGDDNICQHFVSF